MEKEYCEFCGKEIAKPGTIHIAGSVCEGHVFTPLGYAWAKFNLWLIRIFKLPTV